MSFAPFARLLGLQRSASARDRLHELRQKLALTDNDPVWELVAVVEEFCAELKSEAASTSPPPAPTLATSVATASFRFDDFWRLAVVGSAAAGLQTCMLAACFYLGTRNPVTFKEGWLSALLRVPAGWAILALVTPLLAAVAYLGWRARHSDPRVGWSLVLCSTGAAATIFTVLWRAL